MDFINLTSKTDNQPVYINFDKVCEIRAIVQGEKTQGTKVFFCFAADGVQETTDVKETPDQIMAVL